MATTTDYELALLKSNWRGTQYGLLDGGGVREHYEDDYSSASLQVCTRWYDRNQFAKDVLGGAVVVTIGSGTGATKYLSRVTPMPHPEFVDTTGRRRMFATRIANVEPWIPTPENGFPRKIDLTPSWPRGHVFAKMDIEFQTLPYEIRDDNHTDVLTNGVPDESLLKRYVSFDYRPSSEVLVVQGSSFTFVTAGGSPESGPGILLPKFDLAITWHRVPVPAIGTRFLNPGLSEFRIDNALGKVNSATWLGYAVGELLLVGVQMKPYNNPFGERIYDVTFMISINPRNHQKLYNPAAATPAFYELTTDGATNLVAQAAGESLYDFYDLTKIFKPV